MEVYMGFNLTKDKDYTFAYNFFVRYGNWMLIFTNFVPISMLVTLEVVKFIQGMLMERDREMFTRTKKGTFISCKVNCSNLNEELGMVDYIFSDKTGTLTCNIMDFKNLCIGGHGFGAGEGKGVEMTEKEVESRPKVTNVDFRDK